MRMIVFFLFFTYFFTNCLSIHAQFKLIAEGPKFEEPISGHLKVIQMKNGNTIYFHLTPKDGINLRVYDADHKEKISTNFDLGFERVKLASKEGAMFRSSNSETIEAIFEINNELVVFIAECSKKQSDTYRMIIDLVTGKVKQVKNIFTNDNWSSGLAVKRGEGDSYVIVKEYGNEITHYNARHEEISKITYASPLIDDDHKFLRRVDILVTESDKIYGFYSTYGKKKEEGGLYMTSLKQGASAPEYTKLNTPNDLIYKGAIAKYNPVSKKIVFLTIAEIKGKNGGYLPLLYIIDPLTLKAENIESFYPTEELQTQFKERYDKKDGYNALPQDMYIHKDGTISIIYEEMLIQATSSGNYTRNDVKLGKMVVVTLDENGKFLSNYLVPKAQWSTFNELGLFYHKEPKEKALELWVGNQYKSYFYLNSAKGQYILFNDSERNNKVTKDKFTEIQSVSGCDAFAYKFTGKEIFPDRGYLFGKPAKGNIIAMFLISDFDAASNIYVTLKLTKESARDNLVNLVWLQPE